jgi:tetratricopeptide (TPR) repeat protein
MGPVTIAQAIALFRAGCLDEAAAIQQALADAEPESAEPLHLGGVIALRRGDHVTAIALLRQAIARDGARAEYHSNLGAALRAAGRLDEAEEAYSHALTLAPGRAEIVFNLANLLKDAKRWGEAEARYRMAAAWQPDQPRILYNFGSLYYAQARYPEAQRLYRRAIRLAGGSYPEAEINLGMAYHRGGDLVRAERLYDRLVARDPQDAVARFNRSMAHLVTGRLAEGWAGYEWRWRLADIQPTALGGPRWTGGPTEGRTVLVHVEQGLGDTIHFVRYLPRLQALGGPVVLRCQRPLVRLLAASFPGIAVVGEDEPVPSYDLHTALMDLPGLFGTTLETIPADVPYVTPPSPSPPAPVAVRPGTLNVGLVWGGEPTNPSDSQRSIPLADLAPLLEIPGVRWFGLQKGARAAEAASAPWAGRMEDMVVGCGDFADTTAAVAPLDLVIAVDTAVAHLAGALAVPVWILVAASPDWRWLLERDDSPWYPTARLFRQRVQGEWGEVVAQVADRLRTMACAPRGS